MLSKPGAEAPSRLVPSAAGELIELDFETWNSLVFFLKGDRALKSESR